MAVIVLVLEVVDWMKQGMSFEQLSCIQLQEVAVAQRVKTGSKVRTVQVQNY